MSKSLHEAIQQIATRNQPNPVEEQKSTPETEKLVYEYLSSYFGTDLNESIDELDESDFEDAIIAVNTLRNAVNEYFDLEEDSKEERQAAFRKFTTTGPGSRKVSGAVPGGREDKTQSAIDRKRRRLQVKAGKKPTIADTGRRVDVGSENPNVKRRSADVAAKIRGYKASGGG